MAMFRKRCALLALSLFASATAMAHPLPKLSAQGLLTGSAGHTLYTYDADGASGSSHCTGPCAALWPPYVADNTAQPVGQYSITVRADGVHQWVYKSHPLYLYAGDNKPGDAHGDGMNGHWHVVH